MLNIPIVLGHRGASASAAENTQLAYMLAFMQGADGIVADVRLTADNEVVAVHDADLRRTGKRAVKVAKSKLADLQSIDVGATSGPNSYGQRVPALKDILPLIGPHKMLFLNIKSGPGTVSAIAACLKGKRLKADQVQFIAEDEETLAELRKVLPKYPRHLLRQLQWQIKTAEWLPDIKAILGTAKAQEVTGIFFDGRSITQEPAFVKKALAQKFQVHAWQVNRSPKAKKLATAGVSSIITDYPGRISMALMTSEKPAQIAVGKASAAARQAKSSKPAKASKGRPPRLARAS
jgi:glycerophosphoryl diester phosphodiesterase